MSGNFNTFYLLRTTVARHNLRWGGALVDALAGQLYNVQLIVWLR